MITTLMIPIAYLQGEWVLSTPPHVYTHCIYKYPENACHNANTLRFCSHQILDQSQSLTQNSPPQNTTQEVEKLAAKKGVTIQSVKEVLQGLCDDDLVR